MDLLKPDLGLLFWMLLSFGIVFFVLAKYGFPVIVKMVDERKAYIDQSLESAKQANERLANIKVEGEKIVNEARDEQVRILNEANELRNKIISEAKDKAQLEAGKLIEEAQSHIQRDKANAMREIQHQIATLSVDIAEKVLRKNLDNRSAQLELVDKLVAEAQNN
ncbi:MAG: F0F1 ATP synthase subunit B [Candidatus Symbiothrix sp.]|jgi:F-type H+-transporting ATPase subunit b|nr:F0F1 ATP synthase subunit B [Candidatus Symbiothrix sp.]